MKKYLLIATMASTDYEEYHTSTNTYELGTYDDIKDMIKIANDDLKCLAEECYYDDEDNKCQQLRDDYMNSNREEYYDFDISRMRLGSGRILLHVEYVSPELVFGHDITYTIFRIGE